MVTEPRTGPGDVGSALLDAIGGRLAPRRRARATGAWCAPGPTARSRSRRCSHGVRRSCGPTRRARPVARCSSRTSTCSPSSSALHPEPNLSRIERLLTLAWESGAQPVVVLTKADLVGDGDAAGRRRAAWLPRRRGHRLQHRDRGRDRRRSARWRPTTRRSGLLGASGHGKSSLTNALVGTEVLTTLRDPRRRQGPAHVRAARAGGAPRRRRRDRHPGAARRRPAARRRRDWRRRSLTSRRSPGSAGSATAATSRSRGVRCSRRSRRTACRSGGWRAGFACSASWPGWRPAPTRGFAPNR